MTPHIEPVEVSRLPAGQQGMFRHRAVVNARELSVTYRVNEAELQRRQCLTLGAVTNTRTLAALLDLPTDALGQVDPLLADVFDAPATSSLAVIIDDPEGMRWGRRLLTAPLEILEIEVSALTWRRGRDAAHQLAGYGPRVVRLEGRLPRDCTLALTEASHYGIGIVGEDDLLLAPSDFTSARWSAARWQFAEALFEQYLALTI